ncbi:YdeI/OmpD-associated family protein [Jannaschia sp. LMIT008]|uniref:YdeI/OmpD-associated family protein n=1 Tax=Jannaschia maritima TaxID=3032585 RepID=UPI002810DE56|nr:YdeI/OmpD-associated family protein [Jannaschia sp. LMIT008]
MTEVLKGRAVVTVPSRAALRDWLAAVEELLCWGWVDAVTQKVDDDRSAHLIAPRKPTSAWSALNKRLVDQARASGAMTPAGEAAIAVAQGSGTWSFLDDVEAGIVPDDLAAVLGTLNAWNAWPRSVRRGTLEWIKTARTAPTRAKRIADVADAASRSLRPSPFRR